MPSPYELEAIGAADDSVWDEKTSSLLHGTDNDTSAGPITDEDIKSRLSKLSHRSSATSTGQYGPFRYQNPDYISCWPDFSRPSTPFDDRAPGLVDYKVRDAGEGSSKDSGRPISFSNSFAEPQGPRPLSFEITNSQVHRRGERPLSFTKEDEHLTVIQDPMAIQDPRLRRKPFPRVHQADKGNSRSIDPHITDYRCKCAPSEKHSCYFTEEPGKSAKYVRAGPHQARPLARSNATRGRADKRSAGAWEAKAHNFFDPQNLDHRRQLNEKGAAHGFVEVPMELVKPDSRESLHPALRYTTKPLPDISQQNRHIQPHSRRPPMGSTSKSGTQAVSHYKPVFADSRCQGPSRYASVDSRPPDPYRRLPSPPQLRKVKAESALRRPSSSPESHHGVKAGAYTAQSRPKHSNRDSRYSSSGKARYLAQTAEIEPKERSTKNGSRGGRNEPVIQCVVI
jgi:hypothetical protein